MPMVLDLMGLSEMFPVRVSGLGVVVDLCLNPSKLLITGKEIATLSSTRLQQLLVQLDQDAHSVTHTLPPSLFLSLLFRSQCLCELCNPC